MHAALLSPSNDIALKTCSPYWRGRQYGEQFTSTVPVRRPRALPSLSGSGGVTIGAATIASGISCHRLGMRAIGS